MTGERQDEAAVDYLDVPDVARDPAYDVLKVAPELTIDQVYRLQFQLMDRRASRGDRIVGYQASFTSPTMQRQFPDMIAPYFGTLLASNLKRDKTPIPIADGVTYSVEAEIAVLMKRDLAGPGITLADVYHSVDGVLASVECAATRPRDAQGKIACSQHHMIATHNTGSHIVLGNVVRPLDFDLRLEGVAVAVDGVPFSSGSGVEALGNPLNVVAEMANWLGVHGRTLRAGDLLLTGTVAPPPRIAASACVMVEFASLGSLSIQLS